MNANIQMSVTVVRTAPAPLSPRTVGHYHCVEQIGPSVGRTDIREEYVRIYCESDTET